LRYDCFSFYTFLESLRISQGLDSNPSNWLLTDEAQVIFTYAKSRVVSFQNKKLKSQLTLTQMEKSEVREESKLVLEENPKWKYIIKILDEIKKEIEKSSNDKLSGTVLIITKSDHCSQFLQDYIEQGDQTLINRYNFHQETQEKRKLFAQESNEFITKKETAKDFQVGKKSSKRKNSSQEELPKKSKSTKLAKQNQSKLDSISDHFEILEETKNKMKIIIQHYSGVHLENINPSFIILYEPEVSMIRKIELHKAKNPGIPLRVYFMMYENSIEEETYRNTVEKEIENFKRLIDQNSTLSIPLETVLSQNQEKEKLMSLTKSKVIVDVREFRSALPCLLYDHGIEVIPISLAVGDYILHPDIAIERKSTSDLTQSLNAGRLFTQAEKMLKNYKFAGVLIQFDEKESFHLVPSFGKLALQV
jgi:DNA excision repair protein ERCC-4